MEGRHEEALEILLERRFHPWEGGEGAVSKEYRRALIELAKGAFYRGDYDEAAGLLERSLSYPRNLGEGKLPTVEADNEVNYWQARVYAAQGRSEDARRALSAGSAGDETPTISFFYNDRPADALFYQALTRGLAGDEDGARGLLYKLRDHGADHLHDDVRIDFFAVSLPDFLVFEEDVKLRNRRFCTYLLALGEWGLGHRSAGTRRMEQLLHEDPGYPEARYALRFFEQAEKEGQQTHENSPDRG
jgi:tetratricopeptide (TPR) repeat protein